MMQLLGSKHDIDSGLNHEESLYSMRAVVCLIASVMEIGMIGFTLFVLMSLVIYSIYAECMTDRNHGLDGQHCHTRRLITKLLASERHEERYRAARGLLD
jgi:hypothetical protein